MKQKKEKDKWKEAALAVACLHGEKCAGCLKANRKKTDNRNEPASLYGAEALIYDFYFAV